MCKKSSFRFYKEILGRLVLIKEISFMRVFFYFIMRIKGFLIGINW